MIAAVFKRIYGGLDVAHGSSSDIRNTCDYSVLCFSAEFCRGRCNCGAEGLTERVKNAGIVFGTVGDSLYRH